MNFKVTLGPVYNTCDSFPLVHLYQNRTLVLFTKKSVGIPTNCTEVSLSAPFPPRIEACLFRESLIRASDHAPEAGLGDMVSTDDWQMTIRPREERIAAVETRLERSRNALAGLQDRHGRRAVDIKGELELLKDHLRRLFTQGLLTGFASIEDMEDGIGITTSERVAELTAVRQSLLETQNSELKLLQKELMGVLESSTALRSQNNNQQQVLLDKDREIVELRDMLASRAQTDAERLREAQDKLRAQTQGEEQRMRQLQERLQGHSQGDAARLRDLEERLRTQAQALNAKSAAMEELRGVLQKETEGRALAVEEASRMHSASSASLEKQLRKTIEEKDALDVQARKLTQEREALQVQLRSMEARLLEQQQNRSNGQLSQMDSLGKEIAKWQAAAEGKTTQIETMSDELTQLRHENAMLRKRMHKEELEATKDRTFVSQKLSSNETMVENLHRAALRMTRATEPASEAARLMSEGRQDLTTALQREQEVVKMLQETSEKAAARQRELTEAEKEIARLQSTNRSLQDESHSSLRRSQDDSQATLRRLQGQVQQVGEERDRALSEVQELRMLAKLLEETKGESAELHKELVDAKARNAALGNRLEKTEEAKQKLEQARTELIQEMGKIQAAREQMVQEVEGVRGKLRDVELRKEHAEQQVEEQRSVVEHVNGVLNNMRTEIGTHKQKIQELEREREQMRGVLRELRDDKDRWSSEVAAARQEVAALKDGKEKAEGDRDELQKYVRDLTEKVEKLVDEAKRRQEVLEHTNQVISKLQSSNEELQNQLSRKVAVINDLDHDKARLLAEVAEREDEGEAQVDAVKQMTEKLSQQAILLRQRNEELAGSRDAMQTLRDKVNDREAVLLRASDAEQRLVIALAAVNSKDAALIRKEEQIDALERKLKEVQGQHRTVMARVDEAREEREDQHQAPQGRAASEEELLDAKATIASLQGEIEHLTDLLVDKADAKADDEEDADNVIIQDLRSRLDKTQRQVEDGTRANDSLKGRVQELEVQLTEERAKPPAVAERALPAVEVAPVAAAPPAVEVRDDGRLREAEERARRLEADLEAEREQQSEQVMQIEALQARAEKLQTENERLQDELRSRTKADSSADTSALETKVRRQEEELAGLRGEVERLRGQQPGDGEAEGLREELAREMEANKEQLARNSTVMAVQQEKIAAQGEQERKLLEQLKTSKDEMAVLTEHNTMLAKALKGEREKASGAPQYEPAEVRRLQDQLRKAVERGHEIQSEKEEALQVASQAMAAANGIRERLRSTQRAGLRKILGYWREHNLSVGLQGWVQAHERVKMDAVLSEAVGQSETYESMRYKPTRVEI